MGHLLLIGSMELGICIRQSPDFAGMNASSQTCQKREREFGTDVSRKHSLVFENN